MKYCCKTGNEIESTVFQKSKTVGKSFLFFTGQYFVENTSDRFPKDSFIKR